ncbi:energy-coupling factor ABC transporter permease [Uruburuella testudinis]|uniref:Energy-coupling factor ABC transporter permease n=1 Tax=Uruburuella testudinis TaxID=1282863 RepID=A0ABY4DPP6_9NEIS|nr:energy-coupling factor ABC transporter permease [Uruburuella testudinis]UOO81010.1 energy-coupling factor ABC transporter permease [Uruburuella testudinis]
MNFLAHWFDPFTLHVANGILLLLLAAAAKPACLAVAGRPAAAAGAVLILAVLWGLHVELGSGHLAGITYHLLGISLITLMVGAPAALWLGTLMLLPYTWLLHGAGNLHVVGLNALLLLLPAISVNLWLRRCCTKLPPNLFIYIFVNGFISAALGLLFTGALLVAALQAAAVYSAETLWRGAFPVFFLLAWGEAFLTGIFTAVFVALAPQWLITFDDGHYLQQRNEIWKA